MAWEENPRICLHMQLIAILSRTEVIFFFFLDYKEFFTPYFDTSKPVAKKEPTTVKQLRKHAT